MVMTSPSKKNHYFPWRSDSTSTMFFIFFSIVLGTIIQAIGVAAAVFSSPSSAAGSREQEAAQHGCEVVAQHVEDEHFLREWNQQKGAVITPLDVVTQLAASRSALCLKNEQIRDLSSQLTAKSITDTQYELALAALMAEREALQREVEDLQAKAEWAEKEVSRLRQQRLQDQEDRRKRGNAAYLRRQLEAARVTDLVETREAAAAAAERQRLRAEFKEKERRLKDEYEKQREKALREAKDRLNGLRGQVSQMERCNRELKAKLATQPPRSTASSSQDAATKKGSKLMDDTGAVETLGNEFEVYQQLVEHLETLKELALLPGEEDDRIWIEHLTEQLSRLQLFLERSGYYVATQVESQNCSSVSDVDADGVSPHSDHRSCSPINDHLVGRFSAIANILGLGREQGLEETTTVKRKTPKAGAARERVSSSTTTSAGTPRCASISSLLSATPAESSASAESADASIGTADASGGLAPEAVASSEQQVTVESRTVESRSPQSSNSTGSPHSTRRRKPQSKTSKAQAKASQALLLGSTKASTSKGELIGAEQGRSCTDFRMTSTAASSSESSAASTASSPSTSRSFRTRLSRAISSLQYVSKGMHLLHDTIVILGKNAVLECEIVLLFLLRQLLTLKRVLLPLIFNLAEGVRVVIEECGGPTVKLAEEWDEDQAQMFDGATRVSSVACLISGWIYMNRDDLGWVDVEVLPSPFFPAHAHRCTWATLLSFQVVGAVVTHTLWQFTNGKGLALRTLLLSTLASATLCVLVEASRNIAPTTESSELDVRSSLCTIDDLENRLSALTLSAMSDPIADDGSTCRNTQSIPANMVSSVSSPKCTVDPVTGSIRGNLCCSTFLRRDLLSFQEFMRSNGSERLGEVSLAGHTFLKHEKPLFSKEKEDDLHSRDEDDEDQEEFRVALRTSIGITLQALLYVWSNFFADPPVESCGYDSEDEHKQSVAFAKQAAKAVANKGSSGSSRRPKGRRRG
ncbi:unnamed protein product [Amoebophrya sp. A25]|nr:unnamed protein product [Amoebophrya sp. A25]|eukprot:GSA25T00017273001.1